jgi:hypothetical protein
MRRLLRCQAVLGCFFFVLENVDGIMIRFGTPVISTAWPAGNASNKLS